MKTIRKAIALLLTMIILNSFCPYALALDEPIININKTKRVRKLTKRLKRLQRQVSRKYEANKVGNKFVKTNNIIKLERQIKLLYRKL